MAVYLTTGSRPSSSEKGDTSAISAHPALAHAATQHLHRNVVLPSWLVCGASPNRGRTGIRDTHSATTICGRQTMDPAHSRCAKRADCAPRNQGHAPSPRCTRLGKSTRGRGQARQGAVRALLERRRRQDHRRRSGHRQCDKECCAGVPRVAAKQDQRPPARRLTRRPPLRPSHLCSRRLTRKPVWKALSGSIWANEVRLPPTAAGARCSSASARFGVTAARCQPFRFGSRRPTSKRP